MHDLVDYVSQEAALAGQQAAAWLRARQADTAAAVPLRAGAGVRYTVPQALRAAGGPVTVRFRVDGVYRDRFVSVYLGGTRVVHRRRRILTPGEMEQVSFDLPPARRAGRSRSAWRWNRWNRGN